MNAMTGKKDFKVSADRYQPILEELLKEEDNKYCADCDAKGPRWASWNIGIFLCIRCAGIHRKLGVHISKVKSVNLDSWTPIQVATIRDMGNSRARLVYEARIPDNFRRPYNDSALESFIRAKYEHKRYVSPDFVFNKPDLDSLANELRRIEQHTKKNRYGSSTYSTTGTPTTRSIITTQTSAVMSNIVGPVEKTKPDLLGDSATVASPIKHADPWSDQCVGSTDKSNFPKGIIEEAAPQTITLDAQSSQPSSDLLGLNFNTTSPPAYSLHSSNTLTSSDLVTSDQAGKTTKDAILALYQQNPQQSFASSAFQPPSTAPNFGQGPNWIQPTNAFQMGSPAGQPYQTSVQSNHMTSGQIQYNQPIMSVGQFCSDHENKSATSIWPTAAHNQSSMFTNQPHTIVPPQQSVDAAHFNPWTATTCASSFPTANNLFPAPAVNPSAAAHQVYLAQVQSQLASLQTGNVVHNAQ